MRIAPAITLTDLQRSELESLSSGRRTEVRVSERAQIILLAAAGKQNKQIADLLGIDRVTAALWRGRFAQWGVVGILKDAPRAGRRRTAGAATKAEEIVRKTTQEKPAGATHWSCRAMAKVVGGERGDRAADLA